MWQALDWGWPLAVHALTHLGHAHGALRNRRVAGRHFLGELVLLQRVERHKAHRGGLFGARLELDLIRFRVLVANALAGVFAVEPRHRAQHRSFLLVYKSAPQRWRVALLRQLVSHSRRGAQSRASGRRRTRRRRRVLRAAAHQRLESRVRRHPSTVGKEKEAASSSSTCGPGLFDFVVVSRRTVRTVEFPSYRTVTDENSFCSARMHGSY